MAHTGTRSELPELPRVTEKMLRAVTGEQITLVAQAGLDIALGLWSQHGVTREQATKVVLSQIESLFIERSN